VIDIAAAVQRFFDRVADGSIEIYNEPSLQYELGVFLRAEVHAAGSRFTQMILKETLASREEQAVDPGADIDLPASLTPPGFHTLLSLYGQERPGHDTMVDPNRLLPVRGRE
jgi:hypothetical protein